MEGFTNDRWNTFRTAVRVRWPDITDEEVELTKGDFGSFKELVKSKTEAQANEDELEELFFRVSSEDANESSAREKSNLFDAEKNYE